MNYDKEEKKRCASASAVTIKRSTSFNINHNVKRRHLLKSQNDNKRQTKKVLPQNECKL